MALLKHPLTLLGREPAKIGRMRASSNASLSATSMSARGLPARPKPSRLHVTRTRVTAAFSAGTTSASRSGSWKTCRPPSRRSQPSSPMHPPRPPRVAEDHGAAAEAQQGSRRVLFSSLAGDCRRGHVGAARRADRRRRQRRPACAYGLRALLSQPACRPRGAAAPASSSSPLHLGPARSALAAA